MEIAKDDYKNFPPFQLVGKNKSGGLFTSPLLSAKEFYRRDAETRRFLNAFVRITIENHSKRLISMRLCGKNLFAVI